MYRRRCVNLAVGSSVKLKISTHTNTQKQDKEKSALHLCASLSILAEGVEAQLLELRLWN